VDGVEYRAIETGTEAHGFPDRGLTRIAGAASRLVEELRPAVLHAATTYHNLQICLALRERHELPVVYEVRGFREEMWRLRVGERGEGSGHYEAEQAAETAAIREADMVVTLSEGMRRNLLDRGQMDGDRIVVIPNAVDADRFTPIPRDATLATRLGIGNDPVIGYVSGFAPYEGIADLLRATAELRRRGRRVRCLLVGDGPPEEREPLEALRASLGLDHGTAILTGRVPHTDVPRYLSLIDVFVVPRTGDRISRLVTPLKPYEAMAMERAVAVSRVEALLEIVSDGETGVTFEPDDHISLADVVESLLDDPLRRRTLGEAARTWVIENRSWRQNGQRYRELYERLGVS
jgi:glycosyltransferase involved in cell wall biosynthesis